VVLVYANVQLKLFTKAQGDITGTVKVRAVLNAVGVAVSRVDRANGVRGHEGVLQGASRVVKGAAATKGTRQKRGDPQ
jgi:hypothetical protein